jgi:protein ImuB
VRLMVVWCPDWPVIAAEIVDGTPAHEPVVVLHANRVVACSEAARREGVRRGLRRREAQGRYPQVHIVEYDAGRDTRAFEPVLAAVEELTPGVEVLRPGACAFAARGPAGYYGGESAAAEHIVEHIAQTCAVEAQVGAADGSFAASLAARAGQLVPPGGTAAFLAGQDIALIGQPALVDLLTRLGVTTLGDFAALPATDVLARFGLAGAVAHRLAAGRDTRPLAVRQPPADLTVEQRFEDPLERVDVAAFAARELAGRLRDRLAAAGLACTRLGLTAVTEHGAQLHRTWRHDGLLTAVAIADRLRWQLDGWLSGTNLRAARPSGGIVALTLVPEGVLGEGGLQPGLWGEAGDERDRAHRALHRVQGMLGPEAVLTGVPAGGRDPGDQVTLVPWGDERVPARPVTPPWPGRLPPPAPAVVLPEPTPAVVLDAAGRPVSVSARLVLSAPPAVLILDPPPTRPTSPTDPPQRPATPGGHPAGQVGRSTKPGEHPAGQGEAKWGVHPAGRGEPGEPPAGEAERPDWQAERPDWQGERPAEGVERAVGQRGRRAAGRVQVRFPADGELPERVAQWAWAQRDPAGAGRVARRSEAQPVAIVAWAGPWPVEERWWAPEEASRRVRFQVYLADGRALLLVLSGGSWSVVASYD